MSKAKMKVCICNANEPGYAEYGRVATAILGTITILALSVLAVAVTFLFLYILGLVLVGTIITIMYQARKGHSIKCSLRRVGLGVLTSSSYYSG